MADIDRYTDFSDDGWIVDAFDGSYATDPSTKIYADEIQKYLQMDNPIQAIKGLIALRAVTAQTLALLRRKQASTTNILLSVIAAIWRISGTS